MAQRCIATLLVLTMLGSISPAMAGDFVNRKLIQPSAATFNQLTGGLAFGTRLNESTASGLLIPRTTVSQIRGAVAMAPPQNPQPSQAPAQDQGSELTTAGKVMKWVGVGLMADGGLDVALGAAVYGNSSCSGSSYCVDFNDATQKVMYGIGIAQIGAGLVLFLVGRTKKR